MVDKFFDRHEFDTMRQEISRLKTQYQTVGDEPDDQLKRLDHNAFGESEHAGPAKNSVTNHLNTVRETYNAAHEKLHSIESALDGVYEAHLDAEKANKNIFTPKD